MKYSKNLKEFWGNWGCVRGGGGVITFLFLRFLAAKQQLYILESDSLTDWLTDSALTLSTNYIDLKVSKLISWYEVNLWYVCQVCLRYISGIYQVYLMYISGISNVYLRYISGVSQVYLRYIFAISQVYLRYISCLSQVYSGIF